MNRRIVTLIELYKYDKYLLKVYVRVERLKPDEFTIHELCYPFSLHLNLLPGEVLFKVYTFCVKISEPTELKKTYFITLCI